MNVITPRTLSDATISALERTAMVLAEPTEAPETLAPSTRFARISYRGPRQGTLILSATDTFLRDLAASLLGVEPSEVSVDEHGTDALKEMANILGGSIILAMSGDVCEFSLGLPEIVSPSDLPRPIHGGESATCAVVADDGVLRVFWTQHAVSMAA